LYFFVQHEENLEAKMMWLKNFERIQEIQQQVIWQPITETEPRAFIPEVLLDFAFQSFSQILQYSYFNNKVCILLNSFKSL